jgi:hypothetical protein
MQCLHINCGASRRGFLSGLAALGAGSLLPGCESLDKNASKASRIDIHYHIAPPSYSAELKSMNREHAAWSIQATLDDMDKSGISTALTSLINPCMQA